MVAKCNVIRVDVSLTNCCQKQRTCNSIEGLEAYNYFVMTDMLLSSVY